MDYKNELQGLLDKVKPIWWAYMHGKPTLNKDLKALSLAYKDLEVRLESSNTQMHTSQGSCDYCSTATKSEYFDAPNYFHRHGSGVITWVVNDCPVMRCPRCGTENEWPYDNEGDHDTAVCYGGCGKMFAMDPEPQAQEDA